VNSSRVAYSERSEPVDHWYTVQLEFHRIQLGYHGFKEIMDLTRSTIQEARKLNLWMAVQVIGIGQDLLDMERELVRWRREITATPCNPMYPPEITLDDGDLDDQDPAWGWR